MLNKFESYDINAKDIKDTCDDCLIGLLDDGFEYNLSDYTIKSTTYYSITIGLEGSYPASNSTLYFNWSYVSDKIINLLIILADTYNIDEVIVECFNPHEYNIISKRFTYDDIIKEPVIKDTIKTFIIFISPKKDGIIKKVKSFLRFK